MLCPVSGPSHLSPISQKRRTCRKISLVQLQQQIGEGFEEYSQIVCQQEHLSIEPDQLRIVPRPIQLKFVDYPEESIQEDGYEGTQKPK